ncbi:hypothetical protein NLJ89_g6209 [Agrocybe chaxingu]|uniref:Uncharacterized protein n=1 Tax=Agrocybe chaxingu TaxID=84603 RepID=A0A9W8JWW7_9AGAR|nr:hypothetical protein NLJ89_g6209 [Agrocybe chaxingu]
MLTPLSEPAFLSFIASYIINPHSILADLASMLLSNLTAASPACSTLLSLKVSVIPDSRLSNSFYPVESRCGSCPAPVPYPSAEPKEMAALPLLLDAFVEGAQIVEDGDLSRRSRKATLHFLANVFANMTVSPIGRNYFLSPQPVNPAKPDSLEYPLAKVVAFTEHTDKVRRGGVASTIKNCSFHAAGHKAILSPESTQAAVPPSKETAPGIDALPYLLLPLAGPEEYDLDDQEKLLEPLQFLPSTKKREPDANIRLTHVETLLLLCHTRWGRDYQRQHGVYEIIRVAHEHETISEHIERLVQLLHGEEPKIINVEEEFEKEIKMAPGPEPTMGDVKEETKPAPPATTDSDDEDMRIEEI